MSKRILSAVSLFAIIPLVIFSMIFPLAVLSFSILRIDTLALRLPHETPENSSEELIDTAFLQIPSNGSYPMGDYITALMPTDCEKLTALPQIALINDLLPEDAKEIFPTDLSQNGSPLINDTDFKVDIENSISAFAPTKKTGNDPLVLVLHTHATESFTTPEESYRIINSDGTQSCYYSPSHTTTRSIDNTKNVVHLGKLFSEKLNTLGIPTLHCTAQHDNPNYNKSYANARETIKGYLEKYPSIEYIVDLHRDSIIRSGGEKIKPVCTIEDESTAQIMLVMGSGDNHPDWRKNLSLALKFKTTADIMYPGFSRPVYLRTWSFNQELCPGAVILEVGSCANSLSEAESAAIHAAEVFARAIMQ
ncbi:MAG: hypothetical protein E7588_03740 [Ruminococcaceae bacterium]|nr:hypothetical protein [Oscillospiraceae bacterium]